MFENLKSAVNAAAPFLILMVSGTPVATVFYPMAENMGGDGWHEGRSIR
jgi:hypothetical protein